VWREGRGPWAQAAGSRACGKPMAKQGRAVLSAPNAKSLRLLSGDASRQVLHNSHREVQAQSLCGMLGWQPGVAGGAERAVLVLSPGFVRGLEQQNLQQIELQSSVDVDWGQHKGRLNFRRDPKGAQAKRASGGDFCAELCAA
jgi:hypothetical protein